MAYSPKQKEYTMNYMKEKLDEIKFRVPKGRKEIIRNHAESQGEKLTPFIIRAIDETMVRDRLHNFPEPTAAHEEAAKLAGTSPRSVQLSEYILNHGTPEQIERARKGGVGNSIEDICIEIMSDMTK